MGLAACLILCGVLAGVGLGPGGRAIAESKMEGATLTVQGLRIMETRRIAGGLNELAVLVNGSMLTSIPITAQVAAATHHLSAPGIGPIGVFQMPPMTIEAGDGVTLRDMAGTMLVSDEEAVRFQRVTAQALAEPTVVSSPQP